jgi:hypothetical protein
MQTDCMHNRLLKGIVRQGWSTDSKVARWFVLSELNFAPCEVIGVNYFYQL